MWQHASSPCTKSNFLGCSGINTSKLIPPQDVKMQENEFANENSLLIPKSKKSI